MLTYKKNKNVFDILEKTLDVTQLQNYIPIYKRFFNINKTNWNSINLDHPPLSQLTIKDTIYCKDTPLFFKFSPLLDPLRYITGHCVDYDFSLPTYTSPPSKLSDANNSAYVDSFFSFLSSELYRKHGFVNGLNFFGSYLGIKKDFVYNLEDEVDHIQSSSYFHEHRNVLFRLNKDVVFSQSRKKKEVLTLSDEPIELTLDSLEDSGSECSSSDTEYGLKVIIHKFPVQVIALEKYEDTLDSLLDDMDSDELTAALMQVIMTLLTYQKLFKFTHNDLHTNNVMYSTTDVPYLYYCYQGTHYKVPTYGKVFRIIDYGRAIYTFQHRRFVSDSFSEDGDAHTQYNLEPFFDCSEPLMLPNYSFDLCRLACSILESIPSSEGIYKVVEEWCNDDMGESVIYTKQGLERYPDFELYRMIVRTVHNHTPEAQLLRPEFATFRCDPIECMNIDAFTLGQSKL
jgi:hypothetical protein